MALSALHLGGVPANGDPGSAAAERARFAPVNTTGRHSHDPKELDVRPQDRPGKVILDRARVSAPVDEQPRARRRRKIPLPDARLRLEGVGPLLRGVTEDGRRRLEKSIHVLVEASGQGLFAMGRLEGLGEASLDPVETRRETQGLLGGGRLPRQPFRARGAAFEVGGDPRGPSRGGALHP